jgi:hypothetical protein
MIPYTFKYSIYEAELLYDVYVLVAFAHIPKIPLMFDDNWLEIKLTQGNSDTHYSDLLSTHT